MRLFNSPTTIPTPEAPAPEADEQRVRILIETAMEQAQSAETDAELIARQLAGELNKENAALSDVRVAVQALYQGDRAAAQAYLDYLAKHGFPEVSETTESRSPITQKQVVPVRSLEAQNQAIARQSVAYGQVTDLFEDAANNIALYGGNLIAELVANSAYSALVFGERRSGTSALLRAIAYDQIAKSGSTILDILDLHNGEWGGLEGIRLSNGSQIVNYLTLSAQADIEAVSNKLTAVAAEVKRRQHQQRSQSRMLSPNKSPPYLFVVDGLSEIHGALPGWSADRRSKDSAFSKAASSLRVVLCHGPAVGVCCVATARDHSSCLCDATALAETKLLFLGRVSNGRNGGYRAIDRAIEDKDLLPSPHDRSRYREAVSVIKQLATPVVFTPNGVPRLGALGDFGGYLFVDLLAHYQQALEVQTS